MPPLQVCQLVSALNIANEGLENEQSRLASILAQHKEESREGGAQARGLQQTIKDLRYLCLLLVSHCGVSTVVS